MRDQKKLNDRDIPLITRRVLQNEEDYAAATTPDDSKTKNACWVMATSGSSSWLVARGSSLSMMRWFSMIL